MGLGGTSGSIPSQPLLIFTSGNVGINSPTTNNERLVVRQTTNDTSSVGFYTSASTGTSYGPLIQAGTNSSDASFRILNQSGTTSYLHVRGDGNVGIGTASPDAGLTIEATSTAFNALSLRDTRAYNASPEAALAFRVKFNSAGAFATPAILFAYKDNTTDGNQAGGIAFLTNANSGPVERMRITSNGNVIIGPSSVADLGSIMTIDGNVNLTNGANRFIYIGSATNYNYQVRTEGDDFAIREAGTTDRLRYSYTNVRWTITGGLTISGSLSKGSGSFRIDHPLPSKKNTHHLVHSFIEGPQADNIYRGKIQLVNGKATINLDQAARMTEGTFIILNGNIQCFTSNESGWTAVKGIVEGNILTIEAQDANCADTISWLVVGERIDQHMLDTEWTDENGKVITEPLKE